MVGPYNEKNFSSGIATKQMKVQNPDDLTEVIQIGLFDTGLTTVATERKFGIITGSAGGPTPALPSTIPPNAPVAVTAAAAALPTNTLVNGAILRAPSGNIASVWVGGDATVAVNNGLEIPPGEGVPVPATNLNEFFRIANAADCRQG